MHYPLSIVLLGTFLVGFTPTEYEQEVATLPPEYLIGGCPTWTPPFTEQLEVQARLVEKYTWSIFTSESVDKMVAFIGPRGAVDFGAGNGYLSYLLKQRGTDSLAIDNWMEGKPNSLWHPVETGSYELLDYTSSRVLILSWPPREEPMALTALERWGGDRLIYVGEILRGTGSYKFHKELSYNWRLVEQVIIPQWRSRGDAVYLFERDPANAISWDWLWINASQCWY